MDSTYVQALLGLVQANADIRRQAENIINGLSIDQLTAALVPCLTVNLPDAGQTETVRCLAAILLRKKLTTGRPPALCSLNQDYKTNLKKCLLEAIIMPAPRHVRLKLCDTTVEVCSVLIRRDERWDEILPFLQQCGTSSDAGLQVAGIWIMGRLSESCPSLLKPHPQSVAEFLKVGLTSKNNELKMTAITATSHVLAGLEKAKTPFEPLAMLLPGVFHECSSDSNNREELLKAFTKIASHRPQIFEAHLENYIQTMSILVRNTDLEESTRRLSYDFIVTLVEGHSEVFASQTQVLEEIVVLAIVLMVSIEDDPTWASQNDGNYDTSEDPCVECGQIGLTRLGHALGDEVFTPALASVMKGFATAPQWTARHSALLAIVQGAEFMSKQNVRQVIPYVTSSLNDDHPRVRWAAAQAICQLANEQGKVIAEEYHKLLIPALLTHMKDPEVPRVVSWVCAALRDVIENMEKEPLVPYLNDIMTICLILVQNCNLWFVQEHAMQVVSWVADCVSENFLPFYGHFEPVLFQVIQQPNLKDTQRGRAMECLTTIGRAVGTTTFLPTFQKFMELTLNVCRSTGGLPPPTWSGYYIMCSWKRASLTVTSQFNQYIQDAIHVALTIIAYDPRTGVNLADEKTYCLDPTVMEEKKSAFEAIQEWISTCKPGIQPWTLTTLERLLPFTATDLSEEVQREATACLSSVIGSLSEQITNEQKPQIQHLGSLVLAGLLKTLDTESEVENQVELVKSIRDIIKKASPALPSDHVVAILEKTKSILDNSLTQTVKRHKEEEEAAKFSGPKNEDDEEIDLEELNLDTWEEVLILKMLGIIGSIFATQSHDVTTSYYNTKLPQLMQWSSTVDKQLLGACEHLPKLYALGFGVEGMKHLPAEAIAQYMQQFLPTLIQICKDEEIEIKKLGVVGLGACARKAGPSFKSVASETIKICITILTDDMDEDEDDDDVVADENMIRDMACGTIASIFMNHSDSVGNVSEILPTWLSWLPIKQDEDQNDICYTVVCQLVANPSMMGPANLTQAARILSEIGDEDVISAPVREQLKQSEEKLKQMGYNVEH